jgi:L-alanine-DL-glutamate epimerase-like enolase superfamily enzyme
MSAPPAQPIQPTPPAQQPRRADLAIASIAVSAYTIPTATPESDGTIAWDSTTIVIVEPTAGGVTGLGYTYADPTSATLMRELLCGTVIGGSAMDVPRAWSAMERAVRNLGRPGIASMAIAGIDNALWDLKARLLELPLCRLLGMERDAVAVYGSGGFTSYSIPELRRHMAHWVEMGIPRVKMKVGRDPAADPARVHAVREAIGPTAELYVDANGGYTQKQALAEAQRFAADDVIWFEEPVYHEDRDALRFIRGHVPPGMNVAIGEYGYDLWYFRRTLEAGAVDVLQADATRCEGISGWLRAATLTEAHFTPLSAHTAPMIHLHPACAIPNFWPIEYFYDHVRIEHMLFDGVVDPVDGALHPDLARPGMGLVLKRADAAPYQVM